MNVEYTFAIIYVYSKGLIFQKEHIELVGIIFFTFGFYRGSCCPVTCVSLFHVIVLSFGF